MIVARGGWYECGRGIRELELDLAPETRSCIIMCVGSSIGFAVGNASSSHCVKWQDHYALELVSGAMHAQPKCTLKRKVSLTKEPYFPRWAEIHSRSTGFPGSFTLTIDQAVGSLFSIITLCKSVALQVQ